jgi:hypothetical protein
MRAGAVALIGFEAAILGMLVARARIKEAVS